MSEKKRQTRKPAPPNETKEARFIRVATPRVQKAIKQISLLGNCASASYSYLPEQVIKMTGAITEALDDTAAKFAGKFSKQGDFTFSS